MDNSDKQSQTQDVSSPIPDTTTQLEDAKMSEQSLKSDPQIPQKSPVRQNPKVLDKPVPQQVFGRNREQTNYSYSGVKRRRQQIMNETQDEYLDHDLYEALRKQDYVMNGKDSRADDRADENSQGEYFDEPDDGDSDAGSMNSYEVTKTYQTILNNVRTNQGIVRSYLDVDSRLEPVDDLD